MCMMMLRAGSLLEMYDSPRARGLPSRCDLRAFNYIQAAAISVHVTTARGRLAVPACFVCRVCTARPPPSRRRSQRGVAHACTQSGIVVPVLSGSTSGLLSRRRAVSASFLVSRPSRRT